MAGGFAGKPVKGTMTGKAYGKAVSSAAKAKRTTTASTGDGRSPMSPKVKQPRKMK